MSIIYKPGEIMKESSNNHSGFPAQNKMRALYPAVHPVTFQKDPSDGTWVMGTRGMEGP